MKKLTLLLIASAMITGGAFAQDKACCKKNNGKCAKTEACSKNKKSCTKACKESAKTASAKKTM